MRPPLRSLAPLAPLGAGSLAPLGAGLLAFLAACSGDQNATPDSALDRDLTLAAAQTTPRLDTAALGDTAVAPSVTPPAPPVVAPTPAPARRAPTRVAAAPAPPRAERPAPAPAPAAEPPAPAPAPAETPVLPAARTSGPSFGRGATFAGTTGSRVCSTSNAPGDRLVATLNAEATAADGTVLPAGTGVVLEVARIAEDGRLELIARGVSLRGTFTPIVADVAVGEAALERRTVAGTSDSKGKAVKGAIAGAILGQILGRDTRSTVIGAAGGAAAGAAAGRLARKEEVCVPAGAPVTITLRDALSVQ
jgi:hypothetical protein